VAYSTVWRHLSIACLRRMPLLKADTDIISQGANRIGLPDRCSSEIVNPSDTFLELMMLTPLKDGRQVSRASEHSTQQHAAHGNSVKVANAAREAMPVENLDNRLNQQVCRQQSGRVSPPVPPPAFGGTRLGGPTRDEAAARPQPNAAGGARSLPRLPHTQPQLSPRTREAAKHQWASKLAPVMETPVPSRSSFRPPVRSPPAAHRETIRSSTPGPSFRATLPAQQQQQQQHSTTRSRSYQPPRPLQQSPSRSQGSIRVNQPAGLLQPPPAPPPPPARSATPGRGPASPPMGKCSPNAQNPHQMPCKLGNPQWGRSASPFPNACQMATACSKFSDKRELMIAVQAQEVEDEGFDGMVAGMVAPRTLSRMSCASSSASEAPGWRPRRGNGHSCCC